MGSLLALLVLQAAASSAPAPEMRGLWVVRTGLVSPDTVDRVVDHAERAGFGALFVQVRGRGDAFYASQLAPRSELLRGQPESFDPLARVLARARGRGLEVHAWINVLLSAHFGQPLPSGHVLARHPEWAMVPRSAAGEALAAPPDLRLGLARRRRSGVEGLYLSPAAPGVPEHLEAVVRELLRGYPVDGLHLDFIRYPGPEYDYSPAALEGFRRWLGRGGDLLALPAQDPASWDDYRRDVLTALVERLSRAARAERPSLRVSAAVISDEEQAEKRRYQSWPLWAARGLLDAVCPMAYTADGRLFRGQVAQARARLGPRLDLWAGVGAYRLSPTEVVEQIRAARQSGASGVIVFSHESLAARDLERLRREAFGKQVVSRQGGGEAAKGSSSR